MIRPLEDSTEPNQSSPVIGFPGIKRAYLWNPQPDILVYELAQATTLLASLPMVAMHMIPPQAIDATYDRMEPGAQRHFQTKERSKILVPQ